MQVVPIHTELRVWDVAKVSSPIECKHPFKYPTDDEWICSICDEAVAAPTPPSKDEMCGPRGGRLRGKKKSLGGEGAP